MYLCFFFFFFNDTATTEIYTESDTLSLHDALPISAYDRDATVHRLFERRAAETPRSEEHTSELQSPDTISYAVFCLKKKKKNPNNRHCLNCKTRDINREDRSAQ